MEKFYKRFTCKKWRKFFIGDFHVKLKVSFEFFIRDFPGKKIKWKKFLKGFLWKIEAGGKILKGFPFKFTTWLVLHVLHFIGNFFYNPRASLARAAFKRDFLVKSKAISFFWWKLRKCYIKGISEKLVFNGEYIAEHTPWLVLHVLHFIGDFFYNPRASLARAAFKRYFLIKGNFI